MKKSKINLSQMAKNWSAPYVVRNEVDRFSGGMIKPRYLANLDSKGLGPEERFRMGRKVVYPVASIVSWLESRCQEIR